MPGRVVRQGRTYRGMTGLPNSVIGEKGRESPKTAGGEKGHAP